MAAVVLFWQVAELLFTIDIPAKIRLIGRVIYPLFSMVIAS
jgi:hypothetical protein